MNIKKYLEKIDYSKVPKHIAIIMDGNGRWAKAKGLPRVAGHRQGVEAIKRVSEICQELGVQYLTLFAFSTENWKRPKSEVDFLMSLPQEYLKRELNNLKKNNIKITVMGDLHSLPSKTREVVENGIEETRNNTSLNMNFALNYGGRKEIIDTCRKLAKKVADKEIDVSDITEEFFSNYLYSPHIPDPDLLVRTSGELRISNFLLWELAYSEFWFDDVLWPDFQKESLLQAVLDYQNRKRRFGKVEK
ncbi:isoprenyl transferase [Natranaerobius trueperi]|uniref:isoprenyl transferase n=1 Tax=Natranaerobius trueperi TaxID=759412 RepID=UPI001F0A933E|nr:isoprenyl transferase [Natranaerobius trueperi]